MSEKDLDYYIRQANGDKDSTKDIVFKSVTLSEGNAAPIFPASSEFANKIKDKNN